MFELGEHGRGEYAVGGDILVAAHARGETATVASGEPVQRQTFRAGCGTNPVKLFAEHRLRVGVFRRIAHQQVKPRRDVLHAVHEEQEMHHRRPRQCIKGKPARPRQAAR